MRRLAVFVLVTLATSAICVGASQTPAPPTLADANALLATGQAQEDSGQLDKALATYSQVLQLSATPVFPTRMAMASIAGVYALKGDREKAYEWLITLADSHPAQAFVAIVSGAKEFAALKDEARFKQVLERMKPCNSTEYHQFDFWIGSWEVQNPKGQVLGHNDVTRQAGGCILQENWASARTESGTSFNFYDYRDKKWHQDYYDNSGNMGNYPPLAGEFHDGRMVLASAPGVQPMSRWTWYVLSPGKVRQMAEQSADGGKTWSITWDSVYVKPSTN